MRTALVKKKLFLLLVLSFLAPLASAFSQAHKRIINGTLSVNETPWMVSLSSEWTTASQGHFCGGTLIKTDWVLTAAHCVNELKNNPTSLRISYGIKNLYSTDLKSVLADGVVVHENYDEDILVNDLALVHLSTPILDATPLQIVSNPESRYQNATVYGWGLTKRPAADESGELSPTLQQANLPVQTDERCNQAFGESYVQSSMLCAGILSSSSKTVDGVDSCSGDSGGPLVADIDGNAALVGVVSWGAQCADNRSFGVYTRVSSFIDWVNRPRVLPAYFKNGVKVIGKSVAGSSLTCLGELPAGATADQTIYRWINSESGIILSEGRTLRLRPSHVGQSVRCVVDLTNSGGVTQTFSRPTYRISGQRALKTFRPKSAVLSTAEIRCSGSKCRFDLQTDTSVNKLWTYLTPSACSRKECSERVKVKAKKSTDNSWVVEWDRAKFSLPTKSTRIAVKVNKPSVSAITVSL